MSIYLKSLQFLLTAPVWTLPRGDKRDVVQSKLQCKLWIETAASTALAAALVFPIVIAERNFQEGFRFVSNAAGVDTGMINLLSIVASCAFLYFVSIGICKVDTQTAGIADVFVKSYYAYRMAMDRNWAFMSFNVAGLTARPTTVQPAWDTIKHAGILRPYIEGVSRSWAPTMASLYGYQEEN